MSKDKKILKVVKDNQLSLDEMMEYLDSIVTMNGYTLGEMAALFTATLERQLHKDKTKAYLSHIGIYQDVFTIEQVTVIQRMWAEEYARELAVKHESDTASKTD